MIIGIDPGNEGAIAIISSTGKLIAVHDMPIAKVNNKKRSIARSSALF
ncbi:MAG: hypothetical protein GYB18_19900 [Oceanospirillales bacterium]|nr:hypothetical protein [Oceanospirillales bacterium]